MGPAGSLPPDFDRGVMTNVGQGDCLVSADADITFSTVLGSCVAACVRDIVANVGGMNHFLLAEQSDAARDRYGESARYGAFAMEELINKVLTRGTGRKTNLEIKVFGGASINPALPNIGAKNVDFVQDFLANEGYAAIKRDLGGNFARRVLFKPHSGRALVKRLDGNAVASVAAQELRYAGQRFKPPVGEIELF